MLDISNFVTLLIISVTHSTCGVLCTVVGGVCTAASTILAVAIAKFRRIKIGIKSSTRDSSKYYLISGDSSSKSVDTGAIN